MEIDDVNLPPQGGSDTPVVGASGDIVPVPDASSSSQGLAGGLVTSAPVQSMIVSNEQVRVNLIFSEGEYKADVIQTQGTPNMESMPERLPEVTVIPLNKPKKRATGRARAIDKPDVDYMNLVTSSDNASIASSQATCNTNKTNSKRTKTAKKRKCKNNIESSTSEEEETIGGNMLTYKQRLEAGKLLQDVADMSTAEIGAHIKGWLREVDSARAKSSNLKGDLSKKIKVCTHAVMEATQLLEARAIYKGDSKYLEEKLDRLTKEMVTMKQENEFLKKKLENMEKKSLQVNREDSLSPIPGTKIPFNEDEDIFSTIEEIHVPPAIRPSIQGVSKVIDPGYKVLRNRVVPSKEGNTQHNKEGVEEDTLIKWTPPPLIPSSQITSDVKVEGPFKEVLTAINGLTAVVQNLVHLQVTGSQKNKGMIRLLLHSGLLRLLLHAPLLGLDILLLGLLLLHP
ncbi:uncharacterized protein [Linepithema humile]|uniref:uncharacterized protein isoform X2 n=1 Tax=Linepithema humile TaxID=83485 RepID=UPI00351E0C1B